MIKDRWDKEKDHQYYLCSYQNCNTTIMKIIGDGYHATPEQIEQKNGSMYCEFHTKQIDLLLKENGF